MIRCSLGTAKVLGLKRIKVDDLPTTAYLMVGERCRFNCAFCAQARESGARSDMLSRVTWPQFLRGDFLQGLKGEQARDTFKRICFQVVQDEDALAATKSWVKEVKGHSDAPVCVSAGPRSLAEIEELLELGVDHVSIALDAATPHVYTYVKDGSWSGRYSLLTEAVVRFPGRMATHLIVGLGETEEEMVRLLQDLYDRGITVALFAFTPVRGTRLEQCAQPALVHYRRVQAAHFLIREGRARVEQFGFKDGRITGFGMSPARLHELLEDGEAFRTSGCSGCNRPYYNETPGETMYNYPRPLTKEEAAQAWEILSTGLQSKS